MYYSRPQNWSLEIVVITCISKIEDIPSGTSTHMSTSSA
jgi:hypothetical protein